MKLADERIGATSFTAWYRLVTSLVERLGLAQVRARLLSEVSGKVLEIGVGTGASLPHYGAGVELTILEPNPRMIEVLRGKLGGRNVEFIDQRIEDLERDGSMAGRFDYVVSNLVLCSVDDLTRSLEVISQLLKPTGKFLFLEHEVAPGFYAPFQKLVTPFWSKMADGCHLNREIVIAMDESPLAVVELIRFRFPLGAPLVPYGIVGSARLKAYFVE